MDDDWEPAGVPPRGTRWVRDGDGGWRAVGRDEAAVFVPGASGRGR